MSASRAALRRCVNTQDPSHLDAALHLFQGLPEDVPGRGRLAADLFSGMLSIGAAFSPRYIVATVKLARAVDTAAPADQPDDWAFLAAVTRFMIAAAVGAGWVAPPPGLSPAQLAANVGRLAPVLAERDPVLGEAAEAAQAALTGQVLTSRLTVSELREPGLHGPAAFRVADRLRISGWPELFRELGVYQEARRRRDHAALDASAARLDDLFAKMLASMANLPGDLPPHRMLRDWSSSMLDATRRSGYRTPGAPRPAGSPGSAADEPVPDLATLVAQGRIRPAEMAVAIAAHSLVRVREDDPASYDRAVDDWREAVRIAQRTDDYDETMWIGAGRAHFLRAVSDHARPGDVERAIELFERAVGMVETQARFPWAELSYQLTRAYAMADRPADAKRAALRGLRATAWNALLESNPRDAHTAVFDAGEYAIRTAVALLIQGDVDGVVQILEAGRGLIVTASRHGADMPRRLARAGRADLARAWEDAVLAAGADAVPGRLRRQAFAALAGIPLRPDGEPAVSPAEAGAAFLDPPGTAEIGAALRRLDADALVYLVPGTTTPGFAVVVPPTGPASILALDDLKSSNPERFEELVQMISRDARLGPGEAVDASRDAETATVSLDPFCRWAWRAVMLPLLRHLEDRGIVRFDGKPATVRPGGIFGPRLDGETAFLRALTRRPSRRPARRRPPRLVLVPMGRLALVPWHAAAYEHDGETRFALEHAVFSYAASARLVVEGARRDRTDLSGEALVVGDPDTRDDVADLPSARVEAVCIRDVFYPEARYVGRLPDGTPAPDGAGTLSAVAGWLTAPGRGAVLHAACHGGVQTGPEHADTSYLALHGGERLSAEAIAGSVAQSGDPAISLAVLAACSTAKSGRGYDEAFNLGTVLLAQGTRSVVSAQWPVPDGDTSVLMFMLHHFLRAEGLAPADALRAAQLWFLRDRRAPATMPEALRSRLARVGEPTLASWAGFVHSGC